MIRTETDHTVTLRRPDPETGEVVAVDVTVKRGKHTKGTSKNPDFDAALDALWSAGLAADDDRLEPVEEAEEPVEAAEAAAVEAPADPAQEG